MGQKTSRSQAPRHRGDNKDGIRIVVIAGYAILVEAIHHLLTTYDDLDVAGTAGDGATAVDVVQRRRPDVVLLAHFGSALDELDVIGRLNAASSAPRILILSHDASQHASLRMLRAGAHGILSPDVGSAEVVQAIRTVHQGQLFLTPELQRACAERYLGVDSEQAPEERLTDREFQVMRFLALGHTNREIAGQLGVGVKTIDTHRANLLRKLDLRNNADVARFAIKKGVVKI
ncbi:MAG: DNA-binding response regulator [Acidobacteria bacterium]|nr:MAG: DNA-binding response regulator [Acidobacteriota bacterium]